MNYKLIGYCVLCALLMTGCGGGSTSADSNADTSEEQEHTMEQTEYISSVPSPYFKASAMKGSVVAETYRSYDYTSNDSNDITKTAYVYLPYGYNSEDKSTRYDILYLMHGWTMTAGDFFSDSSLTNILDNLIANGNIKPVIVVCATFDAENKPQSFSRSVEELSVFHKDFRENLLPYIESKYNTYADREHRAFGGFSLGAVTTWYQFIYSLDCVKYFCR